MPLCSSASSLISKDERQVLATSTAAGRNAFEIMMSRRHEVVVPSDAFESNGKPLNGSLLLQNKLLDLIRSIMKF